MALPVSEHFLCVINPATLVFISIVARFEFHMNAEIVRNCNETGDDGVKHGKKCHIIFGYSRVNALGLHIH